MRKADGVKGVGRVCVEMDVIKLHIYTVGLLFVPLERTDGGLVPSSRA
jgi:hypothetical protein